ncbi:MAG TPA: hypothetical protein DCZ04_17415 [Syntrophorhabdus aromaticivorans]|nr:hypothetical protein [Syntrophorhabdus aromaticivorans]
MEMHDSRGRVAPIKYVFQFMRCLRIPYPLQHRSGTIGIPQDVVLIAAIHFYSMPLEFGINRTDTRQ